MNATIEVLNHRITLALGVIALVGIGLGFMDSRHASASDVKDIADAIKADQIDRLEFEISEAERRAKRITRVPVDQRTVLDTQDLEDAMIQKERYLRKLERLR